MVGASKKKAVKKGSSLAFGTDGRVYATKGNNTLDFWQYNPTTQVWTQKADVPTGAKNCREGVSMASVTVSDTDYVYLLKGSGTFEFYRTYRGAIPGRQCRTHPLARPASPSRTAHVLPMTAATPSTAWKGS